MGSARLIQRFAARRAVALRARRVLERHPGADLRHPRAGAVPVAPELRRARALTLSEVERLARLAAALEERFGYPLDID